MTKLGSITIKEEKTVDLDAIQEDINIMCQEKESLNLLEIPNGLDDVVVQVLEEKNQEIELKIAEIENEILLKTEELDNYLKLK